MLYVLFVGGSVCIYIFFFFNDTATTEIYTLSLHDALPISPVLVCPRKLSGTPSISAFVNLTAFCALVTFDSRKDRKSTRLNSSHSQISYAVFCLKKKIYISTARLVHCDRPT